MTKRATYAFPNAYVDVDEPPNRVFIEKILSLVGIVGTAYLGLTTLILNFEPTGYDPVRQAVSDYAVGRFAVEMELGFFAGGLGVAALAVAIALSKERRIFKVGSSMLLIVGVSLFVVGLSPTDIEGAAVTLHGTVHGLVSQVVFILGPIGMLLVSYGNGRRWFLPTLSALVAAGALFAADMTLSLHVDGLAERAFILVLLVWWQMVSLRLFKTL